MKKSRRKRTRRKTVKRSNSHTHNRGRAVYEKGHLFENVVSKFFEYKGYNVRRNERIRGLSGAVHEIDVALIKDYKLVGVAEAKNYKKSIPKEWVMKIYEVGKDVGAKEYYIVSATGFTKDAIKVAKVLGVQLLDLNDMAREVEKLDKIKKTRIYYLKPIYTQEDIIGFASKHARKRFFRPIEEPTKVSLIYIPFYLLECEYSYMEERGFIISKKYKVKRKVKLLAHATLKKLSLLRCYEDSCELFDVPFLTNDEIKVLKAMKSIGDYAYYEDIESTTRWSRSKVAKIMNLLANKGLVDIDEEGKRKIFSLTELPSFELFEETATTIINTSKMLEGMPRDGKLVEAIPLPNDVETLIVVIFGIEVKNSKLVYLPIYRVKLESLEDETYREICFLPVEENITIQCDIIS